MQLSYTSSAHATSVLSNPGCLQLTGSENPQETAGALGSVLVDKVPPG